MVSLPGMMTRQILGGVPLAESVKSQILVMFRHTPSPSGETSFESCPCVIPAVEEPMVRRLSAGGEWMRNFGSWGEVPRTHPAIDDGGSQGKRYAVGCLPRRRVVRHQVRGQRSLGIPSRRRRADFTSSTALRPWKSSATTGRPSLSRSAPEYWLSIRRVHGTAFTRRRA